MFTILIMLGCLVIDTFIVTGVNGLSLKENLTTYLGIETLFSIIGFLIGSVFLLYVPEDLFKLVCGLIIILIQFIDIIGYEYPEKVNALLLGSDSLIVFATLSWIYIPILAIFEALAITLGSLIGPKIMDSVPRMIREYLSNIVLSLIGLSMLIEFFV
ncbi:MAG: hypothetical protein MJ232_08525 [archaeon]|nr:hypothetical protein [archaeon]